MSKVKVGVAGYGVLGCKNGGVINNIRLFAAETTGVGKNKLTARISTTARRIWALYVILTLSEVMLLQMGGMPLFDCVCQALSTTATGGFSTPTAIAHIAKSPYLQYVVTAFMYLSGMNFVILYLLLSGKLRKVWNNDELKWYSGSIVLFTLIISTILWYKGLDIADALRNGLFNVVSMHTSTGFSTHDLSVLPSFVWLIFMVLMTVGACSGSTSGGIKMVRVVIVFRCLRNEFKRILHPNIVLPMNINGRPVSQQVITTSLLLLIVSILMVWLSTFIFMDYGYSFTGSLTFSIASLGNTGLARGEFNDPAYLEALPMAGKYMSIALMLLGRLELFTILLLFTPSFWRRTVF